jgi:hypothetical protein
MEVSDQLYLRERAPRYPLDIRLGGPKSRSGRCGVEGNILLLPEIARSSSLYRLSYPDSSSYIHN